MTRCKHHGVPRSSGSPRCRETLVRRHYVRITASHEPPVRNPSTERQSCESSRGPSTWHHRVALVLVLAFAVAITLDPGSDRAGSATLLVGNLHAGSNGAPFEGDRANFVTI